MSTAVLPPISEKRYMRQILDAALLEGWVFAYHPWLSIKSEVGWPDLFLVKGERALALEVKVESVRPGSEPAEQRAWIAALDRVPGITARFVRPSDWDDVVALLKGA